MDIKTRSQAIADGDKTYFTGKLCKNGHMNYRYVLSGSCCDCVNSSRLLINSSDRNEALALVANRNAVRGNLILAKFRCFPSDAEDVKLMVYASVLMRFHEAVFDHIDPKLPATDFGGGTGLHRLYCHHDDVAQLISEVDKLTLMRHRVDVTSGYKKALETNLGDFKDTTPPMNFN